MSGSTRLVASRGSPTSAGRTKRVFSLDAISPTWQEVRPSPRTLRPPAPSSRHPSRTPRSRTAPKRSGAHGTARWSSAPSGGALGGQPRPNRCRLLRHGHPRRDRGRRGPPSDAPHLPTLADLGEWFYEPDRAVTRAGLTGALAAAVDGTELGAGVGRDGLSGIRHTVGEALPRHRGDAVVPQGTVAMAARPRSRPGDDQSAVSRSTPTCCDDS